MSTTPCTSTVDYENIITLIPGVVAARVVVDQGTVVEVHVLGDTSRHPMQLVRDVESSLMARFGLHVDRRCISVAQVNPTSCEPPRLALHSINLTISNNQAEVKAELGLHDHIISGGARGPATSRGRLVLASQAVLHAVNSIVPAGITFSLEALDTDHVGGELSILAMVSLMYAQKIQNLVGAAFVRRDETEAAGRATLAAINRRLSLYLK